MNRSQLKQTIKSIIRQIKEEKTKKTSSIKSKKELKPELDLYKHTKGKSIGQW